MIYLDNAATSRFKPQSVRDAVNYDLLHSANSGRSGHKDALNAGIKIENCRTFLQNKLGAADGYNLVFTKNCTEALNLGIFGSIFDGARVVTSANEHNSVLRPLFELKKQNKISLFVVTQQESGKISTEHLKRAMEFADFAVVNAVSNVTGATLDLEEIGNIAEKYGVKLIIDASQALPITDVDMDKFNIDMLACPGHKGLHGVQGTGFLVFRNNIKLRPLLCGGTGTASDSTYQPTDPPEAYEAGTQFAGGIAALHEGAKWSYNNLSSYRTNVKKLADETVYVLKNLGANIYCCDNSHGVISFNLGATDSSFVSEKLDEYNIAVRSGLHCAPLVHKFLNTETQGAVRISIGVDNNERDIYGLASALDKINAKIKNQ